MFILIYWWSLVLVLVRWTLVNLQTQKDGPIAAARWNIVLPFLKIPFICIVWDDNTYNVAATATSTSYKMRPKTSKWWLEPHIWNPASFCFSSQRLSHTVILFFFNTSLPPPQFPWHQQWNNDTGSYILSEEKKLEYT